MVVEGTGRGHGRSKRGGREQEPQGRREELNVTTEEIVTVPLNADIWNADEPGAEENATVSWQKGTSQPFKRGRNGGRRKGRERFNLE